MHDFNSSQVFSILTAAGFELKQRLTGMHVVGYTCTKDGKSFVCAHTGAGWYPAERVAEVIAGTAVSA